MDFELKPLNQQVIAITGASSGIGLATAEAAAEAGAKRVLAARGGETLAEVAARLGSGGCEAIDVTADIAESGVEAATDPALEKVGAMSKLSAALAKLMPGLAKKVEAAQAERQQLDEPPRDPEGTLRKPGESGSQRGDGPRGYAPSHR
jgi:NADP-dependent 3-hydroxy acid dehydrogenase YdfG